MKSLSQIKQLCEQIGKDRLIILLIAGILLLAVTTPATEYTGLLQRGKEKQTKESTVGAGAEKVCNTGTEVTEKETDSQEYIRSTEQRLKGVLSKINGAGKTEVLLMTNGSKELVVAKDRPYERENLNEEDAQGGSRSRTAMKDDETTIFWKDTQGNELPFITRELNPQITGVLVVCQGGGDQRVKNEINDAILALFDLDPHKIKIAEMIPNK